MAEDLRSYMAGLETPPVLVERPVASRLEIACVLARLEEEGRYPVVVFRNPLDADGRPCRTPVVSNLFADRGRLAQLLDSTPRELAAACAERAGRTGRTRRTRKPKPKAVRDAPIGAVIRQGDEIDLAALPIPMHHEGDAGPYIASGVVVVKDPETGAVGGTIRPLQLQGPRLLGLPLEPGDRTHEIHEKNRAAGEDTPVAVVLGHHPGFHLGMLLAGNGEDDGYRVAGAMLGEPLTVTPAVSAPGLIVPAAAEIVIEGRIPADRLEPEGPVGERSHRYSRPRTANVIEVEALSQRKGAYFHDLFACHRDHDFLAGLVAESRLLLALRQVHAGTVGLFLPPSGCCRLICYVAVDKEGDDGLPRKIAETILGVDPAIKVVVVVDRDVDIHDEEEVLWAVATRADLHRGVRGMAPARDSAAGRGLIDATLPPDGGRQRVGLPAELLAATRLADYGL